MDLVVTITDHEFAMLRTLFVDPQQHLRGLVQHFLEHARTAIVATEMQRLLDDPGTQTMPATREELVRNAVLTFVEAADSATGGLPNGV